MSARKKVLFILGTRPEAIKLAMLMKQAPSYFESRVCITSQHGSMLRQMLNLFEIKEDYNLEVMRPNQDLAGLTARILEGVSPVLTDFQPNVVLVQGDTTSVFAGALAAFYQRIKVGHVEAGLRSDHRFEPFPEEINRRLVSQMADFHYTPTALASVRLRNEGHGAEHIIQVGNTVIDALEHIRSRFAGEDDDYRRYFHQKGISLNDPFVLVTSHRRENFGQGMLNVCAAVHQLADEGMRVIWPVHLNPQVYDVVHQQLQGHPLITLTEPMEYDKLLYLIYKSELILSDSGGIQEEAPSFGKRVLVLRDRTERPEGIEAGFLHLVGTDSDLIVSTARQYLRQDANLPKANPYGDGKATARILEHLKSVL